MIEEYGTLSEEELLTEIQQELEERSDLDLSLLDFNFEDGKLIVNGTLANDEELQSLVNILENYLDPEDYDLEVELLEGDASGILARKEFASNSEESKEEANIDEELEDLDDDEMDFVEEDEIDDEKW